VYGGMTISSVPVNYAIYEQRRGGSHDFMAPLPLIEQVMAEAIKEAMHG
jgi:hypothetical protein